MYSLQTANQEKKGEINKAIEHYEKGIIGTPPSYLGIKVDLGSLYNQKQRFQDTINLLESLVTEKTKNTSAHLVLGAAYFGVRKTDMALKEFGIAQKLEPKKEGPYISLGLALRQKGQYKEALNQLTKAVNINPHSPVARFELGETYSAMGSNDKALESYNISLSLNKDPNYSKTVRLRISEIYFQQKKFPQSISTCKEILNSGTAIPRVYDLLGSAYQMSSQFDLAEKTFKEMCTKFPNDPFPYYRLGLFYGYVKKYDPAIAQFKKALKLAPEDPMVLKALAVSYNRKGDGKKAIDTAKKLVEVTPKNADTLFYLASLYQDESNDKEAIGLYNSAIE